jgi:hypothetical protein
MSWNRSKDPTVSTYASATCAVNIFKQVLSKEKNLQGCKRVRQILALAVTTPLFFFERSITICESMS